MGQVYLIQPAELVGTNRYKIGMSNLTNLNRIRSYKCGSRYLCFFEQSNARSTERKLIDIFNRRYKLIAGNEYFEVDNESEMVDLFISIVMGTYREDPCRIKTNIELINSDQTEATSTTWLKKYIFSSNGQY